MATPNLCAHCGECEHDNWPDGNGGQLCQDCWETDSDRGWWEMVCALEAALWPSLEDVPCGNDIIGGPVAGMPDNEELSRLVADTNVCEEGA